MIPSLDSSKWPERVGAGVTPAQVGPGVGLFGENSAWVGKRLLSEELKLSRLGIKVSVTARHLHGPSQRAASVRAPKTNSKERPRRNSRRARPDRWPGGGGGGPFRREVGGGFSRVSGFAGCLVGWGCTAGIGAGT